MKSYIDTNILVAACVQDHPHYIPSVELIKRVQSGELKACITSHGLAEFYSVLTRAPFFSLWPLTSFGTESPLLERSGL